MLEFWYIKHGLLGICWTMNKIFDMGIPSRWQFVLVLCHDLFLASSSVRLTCKYYFGFTKRFKTSKKPWAYYWQLRYLNLLCFPYRFLFHLPDVNENMAVYYKALAFWTKFIFKIFVKFQQVLVKLTYLENNLTYFDYFFKEILLRKLSYFNA